MDRGVHFLSNLPRRNRAIIDLLRKFWRLSWPDRILHVEAVVWLAIAAFAVAVLPFRYVGRLAARPALSPQPDPHMRQTKVRRIRQAIITSAQYVPWRALCFQQGLAAQLMLRRRGIPSVLYYGAAQNDLTGLSAHVWVRDGDINVVGGDIAGRFAILAKFPPEETGAVNS